MRCVLLAIRIDLLGKFVAGDKLGSPPKSFIPRISSRPQKNEPKPLEQPDDSRMQLIKLSLAGARLLIRAIKGNCLFASLNEFSLSLSLPPSLSLYGHCKCASDNENRAPKKKNCCLSSDKKRLFDFEQTSTKLGRRKKIPRKRQ